MSANDIIASVANGHGYDGHVKEFSDPKFGAVIPVSSQTDLAGVIQDVMNDPATKAVSNADGSVVHIMNKPRNIIVTLNDSPKAAKFGAGTIYRPTSEIGGKFQRLSDTLDNKISSQNIQEVNAMVDKYDQSGLRQTTKDHMAETKTTAITQHLDQNVQQKGLIVANAGVLDQRFATEANAQKLETQAHQGKAELRGEIENAANNPKSAIEVATNGKSAVIMDPDGNVFEVDVNKDGTMSAKAEFADGRPNVDVELSQRQTSKFMKAVPNLKGPIGQLLTPVIVGTVALASGASPAEAGEAAVDSVAKNTVDAVEDDSNIVVGVAKDAAAFVAPKTVDAVNNDASGLAIAGALVEDALVGGACVVGGAVTGGAAGAATTVTVAGAPLAPAAAVAGGIGGCVVASGAMEGAIDSVKSKVETVVKYAPIVADAAGEVIDAAVEKAEKAIDSVIDYFSDDDNENPPLDDVKAALPTEVTEGMQPEIQAMVEVQASDALLTDVVQDLKEQGSSEFVVSQLEDRKVEVGHEITADLTAKAEEAERLRMQQEQLLAQQASGQQFSPQEYRAGL